MFVQRLIGVIAVCFLLLGGARGESADARACGFRSFNGAPAAIPDLFTLVGKAGHAGGRKSLWISYPRQEPRTQELVDRLSHLSETDRRLTLEALAHEPPRDPNLRLIAKLALYDEKTWNDFFDAFTARALYDDSLVNSLIPLLRNLPESLRAKLHARIPAIYPTLSKINHRFFPQPAFDLRLAPKRSVDAFIQHTLHPDEKMAADVSGGATPAQALDRYFERVRAVTGQTGPGEVYRSAEVLAVARALQGVIRKEAIRRGDPNLSVTVAGSFPNGRAKLGNFDLDTQLSDRSLIDAFPQLDAAGNAAIQAWHPDAKLETQAMHATTTEPFAAQINPAMLRISAGKIELLMYPPLQPLDRDHVMMPYNYPKPQAYLLEAHPQGMPAVTKPRPAPVRAISGLVDDAIHGKNLGRTHWLASPHAEPETQRLVDHLIALPPKKRKRLLADFKADPPRDAEWRRTIGLSLYDRDSWREFLDGAMRSPQADERVFDALVPVMQHMPDDLRDFLLDEIGQRYPTASRLKYVRRFPFFQRTYLSLAPKRVLDVMISHLVRPQQIFAKYAATEGPVAALDRYLAMEKGTVLKNVANGNYRAEQIFAAARAIQKVMREKARAEGVKQPAVTMAGSFPNGRANPTTSDIDVMISDPKIEAWLGLMSEKVNSSLGDGFRLEVHAMLPTTTAHNAAIVNPIQIHISEDKIEVLVFPPFRPLEGDKYYLPQNYAPPQRYLIDDKTGKNQTSMVQRVEWFLVA